MSTIPTYPNAAPLAGDELLAGWQDGKQVAMPVSKVTDAANAGAALLVAQAEQAATDAQSAAAASTSSAAQIIGALAGVGIARLSDGNPNELLVDGPAIANQTTFFVLIVAANVAGPVFLTLAGHRMRVAHGGTNTDPAAGELVKGRVARLTYSIEGGIYVLESVQPYADYLAPDALAAINADTAGARQALTALFNVPLASMAGDNVNAITIDHAALADQATIDALILAPNTAAATLTVGGITRRITANAGTGADLTGGELVAGRIGTFQYSDGGGVYILAGLRLPTLGPALPVGSRAASLIGQPWGSISFPAGTRQITPVVQTIVTPGSSNANADYVAVGSVPADMIAAELQAAFVGTGQHFVADNQSVQGAPWTTVSGQLLASGAFLAGTARWVIPFYWMNDARSIFYHDYGGFPQQAKAMRDFADFARDHGAEPVYVTGFHPDPRDPVGALDLGYFADQSAAPGGGSSRDMVWPAFKASPVDPEADMVPPTSQALVARDWTGGGVIRTGYQQIWQVNREIRCAAAEKSAMLIDGEWLYFRNCREPIADMDDAALDTLYPRGNPRHPLAPVFQQGLLPGIREWARAMAEGRDDQRIFRGPVMVLAIGPTPSNTYANDATVRANRSGFSAPLLAIQQQLATAGA